MKKLITLLSLTLFLSACGAKYTPMVNTIDISELNIQKDLVKSTKKCAYGLLWLPPFVGSSSAIEAAKEANFTKISAVDNQATSYILFNKTCSVVYGK